MGQLQHDQSPPADRSLMPLVSREIAESEIVESADDVWHDRGLGEYRSVVLTRPLRENEWQMIRAFVRNTDRDDLRLRFGRSIDFRDDAVLKRFFDVDGVTGELIYMLDGAGEVCGILHRVLLSPCEAEIALIVRSDRQRRGIGGKLLRIAVTRATRQSLRALRALILWENVPMRRLARKIGLVPRQSAGFAIEVEVELD
jgi:acetyltransferase